MSLVTMDTSNRSMDVVTKCKTIDTNISSELYLDKISIPTCSVMLI